MPTNERTYTIQVAFSTLNKLKYTDTKLLAKGLSFFDSISWFKKHTA